MVVRIVLNIDFPSLNHVINEAKKGGRGMAYSKMKNELTTKVRLIANNQYKSAGSPVFSENVSFLFEWYSKDARRDPDNIEFGTKFILDGFNKLGLFKDDSYKYTSGLKIHKHYIDKKFPRVVIYMQESNEEIESKILNQFLNINNE